MKTKQEEFAVIDRLLPIFGQRLEEDDLDDARLEQYQRKLDGLASKFQYDESLGSQRFKLYELQALISFAQGDFPKGQEMLREAAAFMQPSDQFVTYAARSFASNVVTIPAVQPALQPFAKYNGKLHGWLALYGVRLLLLPVLIIIDLFSVRSIDMTLTSGTGFDGYFNFAIMGDLVMLVLCAYGLYFYFTKKRLAQKFMPVFEAVSTVFYLMGAIWLNMLIENNSLTPDDNPATKLVWAFIISGLWFIYWLVSKRVRHTFVKS